MKSKKWITMILPLLLLLVLPLHALAEESATAEIPFTVNTLPGTVVIEAIDGAPLPEEAVFEGVSSGKFEITFRDPGDYLYKVYQKPGTEQDVNYDGTVYTVCVSVFVDENGGLYTVSAIHAADSTQKAKGIVFENTPPEPNESSAGSPTTGDESHLLLWLIAMTVSFFGAAACFLLWKNSGGRKESR